MYIHIITNNVLTLLSLLYMCPKRLVKEKGLGNITEKTTRPSIAQRDSIHV